MKKTLYILPWVIVVLLLVWTAVSYFFDRSIKTPAYTVVEKREGYEIRAYEAYLTAQVEVSGTYDEALNQGFRVLADYYIFGNNTKQVGMAMTAPVTEAESEKLAMTAPVMEKESEVLAMTAPVVETGDNTKRIISFVMPSQYTLETLPTPNNPAVKIVPQEARKVAALRFAWFRNTERVVEKKQALLTFLERDSLIPKGVPEYAGYNAPFTAPWLVRNEALVEIE